MDLERPTPELVQLAYRRGLFPMADSESGELGWYSPDPRAVIPLERFHVPRSLARLVRQERFELRTDTAFEAVMRACAESAPGRESSWIDERLIEVYAELHGRRAAHSIEAWRDGGLVGGLYGDSSRFFLKALRLFTKASPRCSLFLGQSKSFCCLA